LTLFSKFQGRISPADARKGQQNQPFSPACPILASFLLSILVNKKLIRAGLVTITQIEAEHEHNQRGRDPLWTTAPEPVFETFAEWRQPDLGDASGVEL
jgi:hypothetical protein